MNSHAQWTGHDTAQPLRTLRRHGNGRLLRAGEAPSAFHPGVRRFLRAGLGLRLPAGSLALRPGRRPLVHNRRPPLVANPCHESSARVIAPPVFALDVYVAPGFCPAAVAVELALGLNVGPGPSARPLLNSALMYRRASALPLN